MGALAVLGWVTIFLASSSPLLAIGGGSGGDLIGPLNQGQTASPVSDPGAVGNILKNIVTWVYEAFFIVAVFLFLLAAYNFLFGGGNEERVKKARQELFYGVIAVIVALLSVGAAYAIDVFLRTGA